MRTVLSLETGAMKDPNAVSVQMGDNIFPIWRALLADRMPWLCRLFNINLLDPKVTTYFTKLITDEIERRDKTKVCPNDVLGKTSITNFNHSYSF